MVGIVSAKLLGHASRLELPPALPGAGAMWNSADELRGDVTSATEEVGCAQEHIEKWREVTIETQLSRGS